MGTLGGLCGGLLAERVAAWFGAGTSSCCSPHCTWHAQVCSGACPRLRVLRAHDQHRETSPIDAVQRYPFLLVLAGSRNCCILRSRAARFRIQGTGCPNDRAWRAAAALLRPLLHGHQSSDLSLADVPYAVCVKHAGLAVTTGALPAYISLGSLTALLLPGFPG